VEVLQAFTEASTGMGTAFMHTSLSDSDVRPSRSGFVKAMMNVDRSLLDNVRKPLMTKVLSPVRKKIAEMKNLQGTIDDRMFAKKEYDHYLTKVENLKTKLKEAEKEDKIAKLTEQVDRNEAKLKDWKTKLTESTKMLRKIFLNYKRSEGILVDGEFKILRFAHARFFVSCTKFMDEIGVNGKSLSLRFFLSLKANTYTHIYIGKETAPPDAQSLMDVLRTDVELRTRSSSNSTHSTTSRTSSLKVDTESFSSSSSSLPLNTPSSRPLPTPPHSGGSRRNLPPTPEEEEQEETPPPRPGRPPRNSMNSRRNHRSLPDVPEEQEEEKVEVEKKKVQRRSLKPWENQSEEEQEEKQEEEEQEAEQEDQDEDDGIVVSADGDFPTATAMYDYEPEEGDEDEVPLQAGDTVEVVNSDNADWWLVRTPDGSSGLVPANYIEMNS